jgi:hypothetical protein
MVIASRHQRRLLTRIIPSETLSPNALCRFQTGLLWACRQSKWITVKSQR